MKRCKKSDTHSYLPSCCEYHINDFKANCRHEVENLKLRDQILTCMRCKEVLDADSFLDKRRMLEFFIEIHGKFDMMYENLKDDVRDLERKVDGINP